MTVETTDGNANARQVLWCLAVIYLAFVIYGSLVPLRIVPIPLDQAFMRFQAIPFLKLDIASRADWVSNLLLFIPLTLLWGQHLIGHRTGSIQLIGYLSIAVAAFLFAGMIEFTQIFFPQRTVSINDIAAETIGGIAGLIAQRLWGNRLEGVIKAIWMKESRSDRISRLLHIYLIILLGFNILPLDLTISPVEIFHKWKEHKIVLIPFAGLKGSLSENLYESLTDVIIWIAPGFLWARSSRRTLRHVVLNGIAASLAIEIAQLFVYSRVTDITDILLAGLGTAAGARLGKMIQTTGLTTFHPEEMFWRLLVLAWGISVLFLFWFPFDFHIKEFSLLEAIKGMMRVPFTTYYFGTEFHAINEALRKIGFFMPGGFFLGMLISKRTRQSQKLLFKICVVVIAAIAFIIETGQYFLPQKTADITDFALELLGGLFGLAISGWLIGARDAQAETPIPEASSAQDTTCPLAVLIDKLRHGLPAISPNRIDTLAISLNLVGLIGYVQIETLFKLPFFWVSALAIAVLMTLTSHRRPYMSLVAYLLIAYGSPRYAKEYLVILESGFMTWIAVAGFVAFLFFKSPGEQKRFQFTVPLFALTAAFFACMLASWINATISGSQHIVDPRHHSNLFVHSALLFSIAAYSLRDESHDRAWLFLLPIIPLVRWVTQGINGIYLDNDLPPIAATLLPISIAGAWFSESKFARLAHSVSALSLVALIGFAQNRAGGVALIIGVLAFFRHLERKKTFTCLVIGILLVAYFTLPLDSYLARFTSIWDSQTTHATAGIDKATVVERLSLWETSIEIISDNPWLGVGPGNYANVSAIYRIGADNLPAHNSLLSLAAEGGLLSAALYLAVFFTALRRTEKLTGQNTSHARLYAIAIQAALLAQFTAGMFISRHDQVLQFVLLGLALSSTYTIAQSSQPLRQRPLS